MKRVPLKQGSMFFATARKVARKLKLLIQESSATLILDSGPGRDFMTFCSLLQTKQGRARILFAILPRQAQDLEQACDSLIALLGVLPEKHSLKRQ